MRARAHLVAAIQRDLREFPIVTLLGARQVGKTTLAHLVSEAWEEVHHFDLERAEDLAFLALPARALGSLTGLVVLDEVQRMPALFQELRPLADRPGIPARFLLLGSASPDLVSGVSETLAGRTSFIAIGGFDLEDLQRGEADQLWARGGFPRAFLAASAPASMRWRKAFMQAFLERDLPQLGIRVASETLRRFWMMLAHSHGQVLNAQRLGESLGVSGHTARHYLDILVGSYMVRLLPPWYANVKKRQVKAPKIYLRDTGILHALLDLPDLRAVRSHPQAGASWEGHVIEQILSVNGDEAYFWATHAGAELDLLLMRSGRRYGIEIKLTETPTVTRSMRIAMEDLELERLLVVHGGTRAFPLADGIEAIPQEAIPDMW